MLQEWITDLGDSGFVLPAAFVVAVMLWLQRAPRLALRWTAAIIAAGVLGGVAKLVFLTCADTAPLLPETRSPSGHAALASTFWFCLAVIFAERSGPRVRGVLLAAAAAVVAGVAATRVTLGFHSVPEVALGLAIGTLIVTWFGRLRFLGPTVFAGASTTVRPRFLALAVVLVVVLLHGRHIHAEGLLHSLALRFGGAAGVCAGP